MYEQNFVCYEAFNVNIQNDTEEGVIWNSEMANFESILTYTGMAEIIIDTIRSIY